jgi:predicted protein tyrosine phosphatase
MPRIHVCPLAQIDETARATGARHMVTIINRGTPVTRPDAIAAERHLYIGVSDITTPLQGHILPGREHVQTLLDFVRAWDRTTPLLIHCFAGVSRSTAAAFIAACALGPHRDEAGIARAIRDASPTATPNARLVEAADELLGRRGRMSAAVERIGRGADCFEGVPFALDIA